MILLALNFASVFLLSIFINSECACPGGWIAFNDKYGKWCFLISAENRTWYGAAAECQSWNAHLAKIDSMVEVLFLKKEIDYTPHVSLPNFWIGGRDSVLWNKFEWTSTGTFVDQGFTYWGPGEPNNLHDVERCLEIRHDSHYHDTWNDVDCHYRYHFICKKSATDTSNTGVPTNVNLQPINNQNTDSHNTYNQNTYNQNTYNTNANNQNTYNQNNNNGSINNGNVYKPIIHGNVAFGKK